MATITKKESRLFGPDVLVTYEGGKKVAETRTETRIFGPDVQVTRDCNGNKVSETRSETRLFSPDVDVTRDRGGKVLGETRRETRIFGPNVDVTRNTNGNKIGESRYESRVFGPDVYVTKGTGKYNQNSTSRDNPGQSGPPLSYSSGSGNIPVREGSYYPGVPNLASDLPVNLPVEERSDRPRWTKERLVSELAYRKDILFSIKEMKYLAQNSSGELKEAVLSFLDNEMTRKAFIEDTVVLTPEDLDKLSEPTLELIVEQEKPENMFAGAVMRIRGSNPALIRIIRYKSEQIGRLAIGNMPYDVLMSILPVAPPYVVDYCTEKFGDDVLLKVAKESSNYRERTRAAEKLYPNSPFRQYLSMQRQVGFLEVVEGMIYALTKT